MWPEWTVALYFIVQSHITRFICASKPSILVLGVCSRSAAAPLVAWWTGGFYYTSSLWLVPPSCFLPVFLYNYIVYIPTLLYFVIQSPFELFPAPWKASSDKPPNDWAGPRPRTNSSEAGQGRMSLEQQGGGADEVENLTGIIEECSGKVHWVEEAK